MRYWIVSSERKPEGPFEIEEVTRRVQAGQLSSDTLVCPEGGSAWIAAGEEFPMLFRGARPPELPIGLAEPSRPAPPPMPAYAPQPTAAPKGDDTAMKVLIPLAVDPVCLVAGYLGLLSLLMFFAPFAIGFGIWGLVRLRNMPDQRGHVRAVIGIAGGCIGMLLLVGLVIGSAMS
ncbi:MAG: hypothetical protein RLY21_405 [Planctomycetota bacterium]|jgi:hypothetical protein